MTSQPLDRDSKPPFLKPFLALTALGLPGVFSLFPLAQQQLAAVDPEAVGLPVELLVIAALAQTALLVVIAVAIVLATGPKVGFVSLIVERVRGGASVWRRLRPQAQLAIALGLVTGGAILMLDAVFLPMSGVDPEAFETAALDPITQLILGLLYGGITEELLMRWGLMSLFAWLGWRLLALRTRDGLPYAGLVWFAIVATAVLFGVGHLPALAAAVPLTPVLVARTIVLNALGGLVFGWLFWRRSLEAAMVSHASVHVAFALWRLISEVLGG
ncbi:MAG: CPBP family intramembrane glutamic endopeptidase [Bacteroidota bacterium]